MEVPEGEETPPEGMNPIAATGALPETSDRCETVLADEGEGEGSEGQILSNVSTAAPVAEETDGVTPDGLVVPEGVEAELEEAADERCAVGEAVEILSGQVTAVTDELLSDDEWIRDELFRTIRALALPLTLFVASGLLFASGLVRTDNAPVNFLAGRQRTKPTE